MMGYNPAPMSQLPSLAVLVEDLLFRTKIETTAHHLNMGMIFLKGNESEIPSGKGISLVILDLHLKGLDPIQWLHEFKRNPKTARVPVLAFFSHVQVDLKRKAVDAGCDIVVPRSVFSVQMTQLLTRYVKSRLPSLS